MNPPEVVVHPVRGGQPGSRAGMWLGAVAICAVAGWMGFEAGRPFVVARRMRSENAGIEQKINAARLENQELRKAARLLDTDQGLETEARRLGYVRPGELPLLVPKRP